MEWGKFADSLKDDLAGEMPEALHIIKRIEDKMQELLEDPDPAKQIAEFTDSTELLKLVNAKLYHILKKTTEKHSVAPSKLTPAKESRSGAYAWFLLTQFFKKKTQETKTE